MATSKNMPIVDWLEIRSSAPAKFIISGEYSVAYERQAIAAAIDLRTKVIIRPNRSGKVQLCLKNLNSNTREWSTTAFSMCRLVSKYSECLEYDESMPAKLNHLLHSRYTKKSPSDVNSTNNDDESSHDRLDITAKQADDATMAFLLLYVGLGDSYSSAARPAIDVEVESDIPVGSGLGSSSAYSVALCAALMRVYRVVAEKFIISNWAFNVDKFFHGRPSGVDSSVITSGGFILFQNGKIKANGPSHKTPIKVMLVDTLVTRSCRTLCEMVKRLHKEDPTRVNGVFNNINELTSQIWRKIVDPSFVPRNIYTFLDSNQECLDALGVGHEKITDIRTRAARHLLTAKQTGAGGGGAVFILYEESSNNENVSNLRAELLKAGYNVHDNFVGCDGMSVDIVADPEREFVLSDR